MEIELERSFRRGIDSPLKPQVPKEVFPKFASTWFEWVSSMVGVKIDCLPFLERRFDWFYEFWILPG